MNEIARLRSICAKYPRLEREVETELILAWQDKQDINARNKVVQAEMLTIWHCARRLQWTGIPFGDMFAVGCQTALLAVDKFDVSLEARFFSYLGIIVFRDIIEYAKATKGAVKRLKHCEFPQADLDASDMQLAHCSATPEQLVVDKMHAEYVSRVWCGIKRVNPRVKAMVHDCCYEDMSREEVCEKYKITRQGLSLNIIRTLDYAAGVMLSQGIEP